MSAATTPDDLKPLTVNVIVGFFALIAIGGTFGWRWIAVALFVDALIDSTIRMWHRCARAAREQ